MKTRFPSLTSYLISLAIFIPASGWAADRFGARTIFRVAILCVHLRLYPCGISATLPGLAAARVVQGLGGAMMVPVGRLLLLRSVERSELVNALSYLTVPALLGPMTMTGPLLGGFITTYFHWRWIFWINVPIGVIGIVLATLFVEDVKDGTASPLYVTGFLLWGLGLALFCSGLAALGAASWRALVSLPWRPMASMPATRRFRSSTSSFFRSKLFEQVSRGAPCSGLGSDRSLFASAHAASRFWLENAIAYAEIDSAKMSAAVSLASVAQQLSLSLGVAAGAGALQGFALFDPGADVLALETFKSAFNAMAAVSLSAVAAFLRLPADVGSEFTRSGSGKATEAISPAGQ
jgi:MFS family permease